MSDLTEEHLTSGTQQGILVRLKLLLQLIMVVIKEDSTEEKKARKKVAEVTSRCATLFKGSRDYVMFLMEPYLVARSLSSILNS